MAAGRGERVRGGAGAAVRAAALSVTRAAALALLILAAGCGGEGAGRDPGPDGAGTDAAADVLPDGAPGDPGGDGGADAGDADGAGEDADGAGPDGSGDADGGEGPDGGDAGDADGDAAADAWPELPPLEVPYVPPAPADPVRDEPFVQERNHATDRRDPALAPLVDVVARPGGFPGGSHLLVTPRGAAWGQDEGGAWILKGPADGEADVHTAASGPGVVALASAAVLYRLGSLGQVARDEAPAGVEILGLESVPGAGAWLATSAGAAPVPSPGVVGWPPPPVAWPSGGAPVTALALSPDGLLLAGHPDGTVTLHDLPAEGLPGPEIATLDPASGLPGGAVRALVTGVVLPVPLDLVVVADGGLAGLDLLQGGGKVAEPVAVDLFAADRVPLGRPAAAARTSDGGFVVATAEGAMRVMDRGTGSEWRVYGAERWLPSEDVRGVATDDGEDLASLHFATAGGPALVTALRVTLEQKMGPFVDRVVARHDRDGAVADSRLSVKGDLSTSIPWDSDNDGSWTAYWLMGECARWRVTGDPAAKEHFDRSLDAMLFLRDVTGTDWFVARSVIRKEGCVLDDCDDPDDGLWYTSPDGKWWVKRDTSNDELMAHFSMMAMAYEFCADDAQKARIAAHMKGILGGMIDHGYQLWDPVTMAVTTYGQMDPEYVNEWIAGRYGDGGLRASILLMGLTVTWWMTGDERFAEAKRFLIEEHGYAEAARTEILHDVRPLSMDNDEMSFWSWWANLRYESDPWLREKWVEGATGVYEVKLKRQQAALWGVLRATTGFDDADVARDVRDWLRRAPVDMVRWDVRNSHRRDVVKVLRPFDPENGGHRSDGRPIPYDERRNDRFNTDQYRLDGGMGGTVEMDGAEVLLCYWMARLFGILEPI